MYVGTPLLHWNIKCACHYYTRWQYKGSNNSGLSHWWAGTLRVPIAIDCKPLVYKKCFGIIENSPPFLFLCDPGIGYQLLVKCAWIKLEQQPMPSQNKLSMTVQDIWKGLQISQHDFVYCTWSCWYSFSTWQCNKTMLAVYIFLLWGSYLDVHCYTQVCFLPKEEVLWQNMLWQLNTEVKLISNSSIKTLMA